MSKFLFLFILTILSFSSVHGTEESFLKPGVTSNTTREGLEGVGVDEHLGEQITLDRMFVDEMGRDVKLQKYFTGKKPVFFTIIYYTCPSLCNFQLNGITEVFKELEWTAGKEFEFVAVSMQPTDTPATARGKKNAYIGEYGRKGAEQGWHFLTGKNENIKALAKEVGFKYKWNDERKEFAHTAVSYLITPEGKISRYLYGIGFTAKTLRLSLVEASNGTIGSVVDHFLLYCFQYDPKKKGYSLLVFNVMRAGAGVTVLLLAMFLFPYWWRQRKLKIKE